MIGPLTVKTGIMLRRVGVDRAVGLSLVGNGWNALSGIVTLLLLTHFLSLIQQGFYYTFAGFLSAIMLFELGLTYVILQFASHERAKLEWTPARTLAGDAQAKGRLAAMLHLSLGWYGIITLFIVATVLPAGLVFFGRHTPPDSPVIWRMPWVWITLVSAGTMALSPLLAVLEGCGLVTEVAGLRTVQNISSSLMLWLALLLHWGLYAAPISGTTMLLCSVGWVGSRYRPFLRDLLSREAYHVKDFRWRTEVWPFQWRIALSSASGYFIFQLFTPVLFATRGAVAAGQMGLSLTITGVIATLALAWLSTKAPRFGTLIAQKEWIQLDNLFFPALRRSWIVAALGIAGFWLVAWFAHREGYPISHRVLAPLPLGLLALTIVVNHAVNAEAIYLRAHKQEPFLGLSLAIAFFVCLGNFLLVKPYGPLGMMANYLLVNLIFGVFGGTWVFVQRRRAWHRDLPENRSPELR